MKHHSYLGSLLAGTLAVAAAPDGQAQTVCLTQRQKLLASDGGSFDRFGWSVSISGDVAIVGADIDDDNGTNSGSAYVYRYDGVSWTEEQKLLASDGAASDWYGHAVSISGDVAIVGAHLDDDNGTASGSAYVYRYDGVSWAEEQKLLASDGAVDDYFGSRVAISGDVAIVGAYLDDGIGPDSGSAYVYRYNGDSWTEEQKLLASDGSAEDVFGGSVSISGDVAIVGAIGHVDGGRDSGWAYVFRYDGAAWTEEQKLLASDGAAGDQFGGSVSVDGDVAIVGVIGDDDDGGNSGSAYVYRHDGAAWTQEQKLLASDGAADDRFGGSVAVDGDVTIVGASRGDDNGSNSGSAYVFRYDGAAWREEQKLLASDGAVDDWFGGSVSINGDAAIVGAPRVYAMAYNAGSAYMFDAGDPSADIDGDRVVAIDDLLAVLAAWGPCAHCCPEDLDRSGSVDVRDLAILLASWG